MRMLFFFFAFISAATGGESEVVLKDGPGKNQVVAHCAMCHSLDYITMNAAILDQAGWEKTVDKMINVMGAPIAPADRRAIIEYLGQNYGK
ncbi:MAG TPA: cytochrome c [Methylococcaceae bacterium]|jgi:cytochrome c5|nr:cytochrome c [Methylococcaceae bacterium]